MKDTTIISILDLKMIFFSTSKIHYGEINQLGWQVLSYGQKVPSCTLELNMLKSTTDFFETSLTII